MKLNVSVSYEIDDSKPPEQLMEDAIELIDAFEISVKLARHTLSEQLMDDVSEAENSVERLVAFCRSGR